MLHLLRRLTALDDTALLGETEKFTEISRRLIVRNNISCAVTGERGAFVSTRPHLEQFLDRLPLATEEFPAEAVGMTPAGRGRFGWITSVPVSYVTRTFRTVPYSHPDAAHLMVLAKMLRAGYLHREIREKGGAYGGLASCNVEGGLFTLLSYRDPHIARTLDVYDDAAKWAADGNFSEEAIKEAQLSVFADLDRPLSPGSRGAHEFANNRQDLTPEKRQDMRRSILATTRAELSRIARTYLLENGARVDSILSNEELLNQAKSTLKGDSIKIERI